jgi:hypothetical protein
MFFFGNIFYCFSICNFNIFFRFLPFYNLDLYKIIINVDLIIIRFFIKFIRKLLYLYLDLDFIFYRNYSP